LINVCDICGRKFAATVSKFTCKQCLDLIDLQQELEEGRQRGNYFFINIDGFLVKINMTNPVKRIKNGLYQLGNSRKRFRKKSDALKFYRNLIGENRFIKKERING